MQFYYHLIIHQRPSKFYTIYSYFNLIIFDRVSNDNKIIWKLKHYQLVKENIYKFFIFYFFYIYLKFHNQRCQNNQLSRILPPTKLYSRPYIRNKTFLVPFILDLMKGSKKIVNRAWKYMTRFWIFKTQTSTWVLQSVLFFFRRV
jgi:hypothetical protein